MNSSVPARFIHIGIGTSGEIPVEALERLFQTALDWMRYDSHCWILYSNTELEIWRDRIRKIEGMKAGTSYMLCEFDASQTSGYLKGPVGVATEKSLTNAFGRLHTVIRDPRVHRGLHPDGFVRMRGRSCSRRSATPRRRRVFRSVEFGQIESSYKRKTYLIGKEQRKVNEVMLLGFAKI